MKYLHYYENIEGLKKYLIISYKLTPHILYIIETISITSKKEYADPDKLIQYEFIYSYNNGELEEKTGGSQTYLKILQNILLFQSDNLEECKMFLTVKKYNL